ncbi:hypothetical protein [Chryseobacterium daeguense]|uniref:hypothetical protein n=1 Tax=Chryseobacterium daeguense TaxID=412438 RepID=UPI0003F79466|nr:hypothetical protein [Chryseobacterium daeguense]
MVTGNGTPINSGTFNYTFTLGSSTCSRDVYYNAQDPAIDPCQTVWLGRSNFPNTYLINGQSVAVNVTTTGYVTAGSQMDSCGGHSTSNSWKIGTYNSPGSITFTFSKPVSNVKINANGWYSGSNNVATVTAKNGATTISNPTLLTSQSCNQVPTVTGNTITQPGTFAVQNTVTSITVSYNGVSNGSPFPAGGLLHISFCDSAQ